MIFLIKNLKEEDSSTKLMVCTFDFSEVNQTKMGARNEIANFGFSRA
jgi:hypothetical protein